ncbi:MAG: hypothetical protein IIA55_11275 [Gemmatimonadetes bacterium]|nr:hypothetical protein [Gemmatimonadota bacterium]
MESRLIEYMRTRLILLSVLIPSLWLVPALCAQATVELIVERTGYQGETLSAVVAEVVRRGLEEPRGLKN